MKRKRAITLDDIRTQLTIKKKRTSQLTYTLSEELKEWFREALEPVLSEYYTRDTLQCAFNKSHDNTPFKVSHYGRNDMNDLIEAFLIAHPGCEALRPKSVWHSLYDEEWRAFYREKAKLRILCAVCYRQSHPQYVQPDQRPKTTTTPKKTITEVLVPYNETKTKSTITHPWLDIKTWHTVLNKKNHYARTLNNKTFMLYPRHNKWLYVYHGKFSETGYDCLDDALKASYKAHGEEIRRYCVV